jgi:mRNA interferase RelE/StbE
VTLQPAARRALRKLDKPVARRVVAVLAGLANDPRPAGAKALVGISPPLLRVRVGDYRIVYEVRDRQLVVLVVLVGHRRDIYRAF